MSTLGNLAVGIIGDSRELNKTLDGVTGRVRKFGQDLQQTGRRVSAVGTGLIKNLTLPIMAATAGLIAITTRAGKFADELLDLSAVTGVHTDQLQRWRYMAVAAGTDTDAVADALSRMNRQMVEGTEFGARLERTAEAYGIALRDANGEVRDGVDVITDLMMAISEIEDPQERARAGAQAFGRDWETIAPIVDLGREAIEKFNEQEVISREQLERANEFRQSMDLLKHELGLVGIEIGMKLIPLAEDLAAVVRDRVVPWVKDLVDRIGELVDWFKNLSPEMQRWTGILIGVAAAAGPVLFIVGKLITAIGTIIAVLSAKIIIIGAVIAAIVAFGVWIYNLIKNNEELMAKLTAVWETIKEVVIDVWEALVETAQHIADWIRDIWEEHGERIMQFLSVVWDQISLTIETAINIIAGIIKFVLALIRGDWEGAWEALAGIGEAIWNYIKGTAENIFNALKEALGLIWDMIGERVTEAWENMKQAVVTKVQEIYDGAKQRLSDLWDWIKGIPGQAYNWGRDILQRLWDGMVSVFNRIKRWFEDNVKSLIDSLNPWSRRSPSLIDDIRSGVREIEKLYASLKLPDIVVQPGPLAAGAGPVQHITVQATYHVTSKEMAEHANNDLVKKLQGRGVRRSFS